MEKLKRYRRYLSLAASPIVTALIVLVVFKQCGFYPFGDKTAAWCDMNQQVVPLLCEFKDILDGKESMFLNFESASGMNFWGVFFFFLASPFSFLVKLVEKHDMLLFANILIILKMCVSAVTSSLYFVRSKRFRSLGFLPILMLSVIYALSGYVMLFYQNVIWLDMMYLFPLLVISLERLREKGSPITYITVMTAMMVVNYYIGYMIVLFVLLFAAAYVLVYGKKDGERAGFVCRRFIIGSAIAALMSAVVWLPCFMQYLTSGRGDSVIENIRTCDFVIDYDTVLPVLMCSSVLIFYAAGHLVRHANDSLDRRLWAIMAILMCIPLVIEPINKLWHTGSYMSFPARYAFITIFVLMTAAAYSLGKEYKYKGSVKHYIISAAVSALSAVLLERIFDSYIDANLDTLSDYTESLGGSESSFKALGKLFIAALICTAVVYFFYRHGWLFRNAFLVFTCMIIVIESLGYVRIYMTSAGERNDSTNQLQREVLDLGDKIDDDSFYRVKTNAKIFDYNMIGAMGYNSIGHYTSLTDEEYMFAMKRLGYTSVWMEVGTCGGTELTDALLSIGYEIKNSQTEDALYSANGYSINKLDNKLSMGIITQGDVSDEEIPSILTRADVQQYLFESVFGSDEELIGKYEPEEGEYEYNTETGKYEVAEEERLIYRVSVTGTQTLYFDCFDELSNELSEPIYDSFRIRVNGETAAQTYPYSKENGVLKLGTFEDEKVIIEVTALKDVSCASFGVFGLDTELLSSECEKLQSADLTETMGGLSGSVTSDGGTMLLSVPYSEGLKVTVNGEEVEYRRALSCFTAFELPSGECDIEVSFTPSGFTAGLVMSIAGVLLLAVYVIMIRLKSKQGVPKKISQRDKWVNFTAKTLVLLLGAFVIIAVYIMPTVINLLFWKKE